MIKIYRFFFNGYQSSSHRYQLTKWQVTTSLIISSACMFPLKKKLQTLTCLMQLYNFFVLKLENENNFDL